MSSVRSTSDGRGPVTRKRVPDREEPGKPRKDARRGRCHLLESGFWPLWMTPLPCKNITEYRIQGGAAVGGGQRLPQPRASPAPSTRPRNSAQLTSFCPVPLGHLDTQANESPGTTSQLTSFCPVPLGTWANRQTNRQSPQQGTTDSVSKRGTKEGTKAKRGTKEGTKPPQSSGDSDQDSVSSSDFMKPRLQVGGQKAATTRKRAMQNNTSDKHPDDSQAAVKRGTKEDTKSEQALVGGSDGACHWPQPSSSKSVGKHTTLCASNTPGGRSRGQPLSMRPASSKYIKVLGIHTVVLCDKVSLPKWCTAELGRLPDRHGAWPWMRVGEGEPPMGGSLRFIFHETAFSKRDVITYS